MKSMIQVVVFVMTCTCIYNVYCVPSRPPSIYVQPAKVVYFKPDETVQLDCIADGVPSPRYEWNFNNKLFDPRRTDGRISMANNYGTLVMYRPQPKDEGIYQCLAYSRAGISLSVNVNLIHAYMQDFPVAENRLIVVRGHFVVLGCNAPYSIPKAKISWGIHDTRAGRINPVHLNKRVTQDLEGRLYITNVRWEDYHEGNPYVCIAQNLFARKLTKSRGYIILPLGNNAVTVLPQLLWSSPHTAIGFLGEEMKLKCIFGGIPTPEVSWSTTDGNIPENRRKSSGGQELIFSSLEKTDEGTYTCYTTDTQVHRNVILSVKSKPYWVVGGEPTDVMAPQGTNATFVCNAGGDPVPDVDWFINGRRLRNSNHMAIIEGRLLKHENTVVVVNIKESDAMVLQCNATNVYDYIFADFYLSVID